jgi:predicted dehydrogenase
VTEKIRWALIGCGDIAEKCTAPAINTDPNSELHAVVRRDREKVKDFAARHESKKYYCSIAEAVRDPEVDALYLATPVAIHKEHTLMGCEAGKHVLCEKPMAVNAQECAEMVRAAQTNGVTLGVSYYRRLNPKIIRAKQLLDQGVIGKPVVVRIDLRGWYDPAPTDPKRWRVHKSESGGGVLLDVGSHRLDLLVHFFGLPELVAGRAQTLAHSYDVDDAATGMMSYKNGLTAWTSFLWSSRTGWDEFDIVGTDGRIVMLPLDSPSLSITAGGKTSEEKLPGPVNRQELLVKDFSRALLEKRAPVVTGVEGRKTTLIMDAIYRSSGSSEFVKISDATLRSSASLRSTR